MEEILYLEPDEEITSVVDKLKGLPGSSVALVLPKNAQLAASVVNLKLLKREATKLKKAISIVTQDKVGISLASQVGIPVYASVSDEVPIRVSSSGKPKPANDEIIELDRKKTVPDEADVPVHRYDATAQPTEDSTTEIEEEEVPTHRPVPTPARPLPRRSGPSIQLRRGPVLAVIALTLVGGLAWLLILYPRATVILGVASDPIHETVSVTVDNNITEPNEAEGKVPGQKLQVETTVKETFESTGQKEVGQKATGQVVLNNRLGETVGVPKGSTIERDGLAFQTTEEVSIGAATVSLDASGNVLVKPGTKQVNVEAKAVGSASNLAPGTFAITSFSGAKRDRVTAENSSTFSGGESHTVRVVTEDDIQKAREQIGSKVNEQLVNELKSKAKDLTVLGTTIQVDIVDSSANKSPDEEADNFELQAKIRARAIGFVAPQYQSMVVALVSKTIPAEKELVVTSEDSVETQVKEAKYDDGILILDSTLSTEMVQRLDTARLKDLIRGKTALTAEQTLKEQPGIQTAQVSLRPSFKSSVPGNDRQIIIELDRQ